MEIISSISWMDLARVNVNVNVNGQAKDLARCIL